jgi:hypothetical protein
MSDETENENNKNDCINEIQNISFDDNMTFVDTLFVLQNFLFIHNILDNHISIILDIYSSKIKKISNYNNYDQDTIFLLLYSSIMLYNDLANAHIINKIKHNEFIKMFDNINNNQLSRELLSDIYNKIYDRIKHENIQNNKLHDKKILTSKSSCVFL